MPPGRVHMVLFMFRGSRDPKPSTDRSRPLPCLTHAMVQVVCVCRTEKEGRQLILHRGLHPVVIDKKGPVHFQPEEAVRVASSVGFCAARDTVIAAFADDGGSGPRLSLRVMTVSSGGSWRFLVEIFGRGHHARRSSYAWRGLGHEPCAWTRPTPFPTATRTRLARCTAFGVIG